MFVTSIRFTEIQLPFGIYAANVDSLLALRNPFTLDYFLWKKQYEQKFIQETGPVKSNVKWIKIGSGKRLLLGGRKSLPEVR